MAVDLKTTFGSVLSELITTTFAVNTVEATLLPSNRASSNIAMRTAADTMHTKKEDTYFLMTNENKTIWTLYITW